MFSTGCLTRLFLEIIRIYVKVYFTIHDEIVNENLATWSRDSGRNAAHLAYGRKMHPAARV